MKKIIPIVVIVIIILIVLIYFLRNKKEYEFKIYFFNSGSSDAMIINNKDKYIMIDTAEESFSDEIIKYFEKNNIKTLDYLIITHFDKDHVGGASKIIDNINVKNVLQSNYPKDSIYYNNYIESLNKKDIEPITVEETLEFHLEELRVVVNGPGMIYTKNESNNSSLITKIYYKNNSFIFMGDTENARLKDFNKINTEKFDFMKVPYHGRYLKQLDELFEITSPKYAVITSSFEDANEKTLELLNKYNVKTYMTRDGDFYIYSDGKNITKSIF